jgi:DNA-binding transcriptional ArsR family regulator
MIENPGDNNNSDKKDPAAGVDKSPRSYIHSATKAAIHPVRSKILKSLKEGDKSTTELEKLTHESRYNLYHHLNALENVGLVNWSMLDNKTKLFHLNKPEAPEAAVIILNEQDIREKANAFAKVLDALNELEGEKIPNPGQITSAEICLYYRTKNNQE